MNSSIIRIQRKESGVRVVAQWLTNPTRNHEVPGLIPGLAQGIKDPALPVSCGVGPRHGSDPELLWLCLWPATASIRSLAWESPYATGVTLEKAKRQKKKKKKKFRDFIVNPVFYRLSLCKQVQDF